MSSPQSLRDAFFSELANPSELLQLFDRFRDVSFFMKNREGQFVALNERGCRYCGITKEEEGFGKTDHDFFSQQRADAYRADDMRVMERDEPIHDRLEEAPEPAGSRRIVATSKIPLHGKDGEVIGVAGLSWPVELLREKDGGVDRFAKVVEHMHSNFAEKLPASELAEMAGLSVAQFQQRFRRAYGASPREFLQRIRIEEAATRLAEGDRSIAEIAQSCGFHDHAHFCRSFRKLMNKTPSEFRAMA